MWVCPPRLYEAGGKRDGRCPRDEGCLRCGHGGSSRGLLIAERGPERGKTRQDIKTPQTPQTLQNKDKKEEEEKKIQILPALFRSHFAVQHDTFGRPVPEKGRCCVSDVSGEVFPLLLWGFVPCFYALLWGRRVPEQSSLNPAASGSGRALPMSDLGCCKGEKRKDKRRNPYAPTCDRLVHCAVSQLFSLAEFGVFFSSPFPTGDKLTECNRSLQLLPGPHGTKCPFPVLPSPAPRVATLLWDTL